MKNGVRRCASYTLGSLNLARGTSNTFIFVTCEIITGEKREQDRSYDPKNYTTVTSEAARGCDRFHSFGKYLTGRLAVLNYGEFPRAITLYSRLRKTVRHTRTKRKEWRFSDARDRRPDGSPRASRRAVSKIRHVLSDGACTRRTSFPGSIKIAALRAYVYIRALCPR